MRGLVRSAAPLLALLLGAPAGRGAEVGGASGEFHSDLLGRTLVVLDGVFSPVEAEKQVLPYMRDQRHLFDGKAVLDVGTGSGIIALYAARLGAKRVVATDISKQAVTCTQFNARNLGFESVVEARWVPPGDATAFAVIERGETFDVIIGNPPYTIDLEAPANSALVDRGDLGFSIVRGLASHLNPGGTAILLYGSYFYHQVIVKFARYLGYRVDHFAPDYSTPWEQDVLFNSYLRRILERQEVDPQAFRFNWLQDERKQIGDLFRLYPSVTIPKQGDVYLGLIVIRKEVAGGGR